MSFQLMYFILQCIFWGLTLGYTFSWVNFTKYQFLERNYETVSKHPEYSRKWHFWKGMNQFLFFYCMTVIWGWKLGLFSATIYWILFDGLVNTRILKRNFFYVGNTARTDIAINYLTKGINWIFKSNISSFYISGILKTLLLLSLVKFIF